MSSQLAKEIDESEKKKKMIAKAERLFFIIISAICCSVAVNACFIPNKMMSGGVGGLGILIQYLTEIPAGISVFVINLPIFLYGSKKIDKEFALYSFISMFILSICLTLTKDISKYFYVDDILLAAVFGGIINGFGMGLLFRNRSSQGGFDIVAVVLRRKYNINISTALMAFNTIVISSTSLLFSYKSAMYTLLSMYIGYRVLDKVQTGLDIKKNVIIVSEKSEEVSRQIIDKTHRGVTFLEGRGGYSHENRNVIYCIVTSKEIPMIKKIIEDIDPNAFLTINDVVEVMGRGFRNCNI